MRLWYLALAAMLICASSAKLHTPTESEESGEDQLVSSSIEKPPTESALEQKKHIEVNSSEEGLNSEEVNQEFEEYDESSSKEVSEQKQEEETSESNPSESNAALENQTPDEPVQTESISPKNEEQLAIEKNSEEQDQNLRNNVTTNEKSKEVLTEFDNDRNQASSEEVEVEPEIEDQHSGEDDHEQSNDTESEKKEEADEESKEESNSEEVEEEPELTDENSEETEQTAKENTEPSQEEEDMTTDAEENEKKNHAYQKEEIDQEDKLEDKSSEEEVKEEGNADAESENKDDDDVKKEGENQTSVDATADGQKAVESTQEEEMFTPGDESNEPANEEAHEKRGSMEETVEEATDSIKDVEEKEPIDIGDSPENVDQDISDSAGSDLESTISNVKQPKEEVDKEKEVTITGTNVREEIIEQAEKAFAELMKKKGEEEEKPAHEGANSDVEQSIVNEEEGAFEKEVAADVNEEIAASETATSEDTTAEEPAPIEEGTTIPNITHVEIRAAIIAEAEKAYKNIILITDKIDEAEELKTEPKLDESEEKEIKTLMTNVLEQKDEALVDKEEKAEEESLVNEIKTNASLIRLKRAAKELAEDPTVQPADASPIELPTETNDATGKNETLPAAIEKDLPKPETEKQDFAKEKFTDVFGWVHFPWKSFPVSKKIYHYQKQCECQVMWIKKVYTRPQQKSKLLLVKSSYIDMMKPRCKKRLSVANSVRKAVVRHAPTPCKRQLRGKEQFVPKSKSIRRFHGESLAEQSWRNHVKKRKTTILEGNESFAKKCGTKRKTPKLHYRRKVSLRH